MASPRLTQFSQGWVRLHLSLRLQSALASPTEMQVSPADELDSVLSVPARCARERHTISSSHHPILAIWRLNRVA